MKLPGAMYDELGLFSWIIILLVPTYILWNVASLVRNYLSVRSSQIPAYICPSNPSSIPWMIAAVPLKPLFRRVLPETVFNRMKPTFYGWEFSAKNELHRQFGPLFFLCTPGLNDLWTSDPEAASDILRRPKDFIPLPLTGVIVGLFGPNLLTAHGEKWQRQRRIIAPNFNEGVSDLVWAESCSQATEMVEYFLQGQGGETDETINGLRQIAIHVIGEAGYGMHTSWKNAIVKSKQKTKADMLTYVEAVNTVINFLVPAALLPAWLFSPSIFPESIRQIGTAKQRFQKLTEEILDKEREDAKDRKSTRKNLMSTLIAFSDAAKESKEESGGTMALTEEQISGNLFLFTAAGYDTTANSLAYGITILAAEPRWQSWLAEEISATLTKFPLTSYEDVFPRLLRTRAFMLETLRLYSPLVHIARSNPAPQMLQTSQGPRLIPANTQCYVNSVALHSDPKTWGADVDEFKPTRWLDTRGELITPSKGTFLPWSAGPRVCPGMKMAQVEFVGVLATLLARAKIEVVQVAGESKDTAQNRLWDLMQDSQSRLTLQMNRPEELRLRFVSIE